MRTATALGVTLALAAPVRADDGDDALRFRAGRSDLVVLGEITSDPVGLVLQSGVMRGADREVSLGGGGVPAATTYSLANLLLGRLTSPTEAAVRAERQLRLQEALNGMDGIDREVLALRHFEELSNSEVAAVLGLTKTAASNQYVRALKRLKEVLSALPDPH